MSTKTPAPYSWYYDIAKLSGERPELLNGIFGTKPSSISEYNGTSLACAGSPYRLVWLAENPDEQWSVKAERGQQGGSVSNILRHYAKDSAPHWQFASTGKQEFFGAHDAVNDAVATLLGSIGCVIDYASRSGVTDKNNSPTSWDSTPHTFAFPWHIIFLDCKGANLPDVTRSFGFAHLSSADVRNVPYKSWYLHIKTGEVINARYKKQRIKLLSAPSHRHLWFTTKHTSFEQMKLAADIAKATVRRDFYHGRRQVLPLALREEAIRNKFWRKCVTRDVVVTRLELTRQVIDFRAIFASSDRTYGQYRNIACDRLVRIMDCIFQNVTRIEMVYDRLTLRYPGTEFRDIVTVKVDSQAKKKARDEKNMEKWSEINEAAWRYLRVS
ncbi:hypothetical protein PTRG_09696 [Pyrenophora tritici-repentis Pt-1C-BFP]|uniref:Uncharacterized protein n=1 Tax=Pyrenophora tritici-repentis (strain Pt-1C-BFP) TaxID=426418 RepID=B2WI87_PYRTR|nr:uncharacterized protein PTRG_09696 [Pyrenophora tritici-repentis Pt-1C-BFP]EDU42747.1 hypothetical protein PTRG_09696 [Pyrenophora tritici-repentis Pt-1C-BFP]